MAESSDLGGKIARWSGNHHHNIIKLDSMMIEVILLLYLMIM